ncbi:MAG: DUF4974 domain-containing protein [Pirellulales bacterium]
MAWNLAARGAAILLFLSAALRISAALAEDAPPRPAPYNASAANPADDEALRAALDKPVSVDIGELALQDLVKLLGEHQVDAYLDTKALEEAGLDTDTPVRPIKLTEISLRSVLDLVLANLDLTYVLRDGKLQITTTDVASQELITRIYRVEDLVRVKDAAGNERDDFDALMNLIANTAKPDTWENVGGPGSMSGFQGTLVVSQTENVHDEIAQLLPALREARVKQQTGVAAEPIDAARPADLALRRKFAEQSRMPADLNFQETPLAEAMARVAEKFGLQIVLDEKALEEAGLGDDTPVTAELRQVPLPTALALILQPLDVTYLVKDEVVLVTTTDVASQELTNVVYPVGDLVQLGAARVGGGHQDFEPLTELITTVVKPDSWSEVGGPGQLEPFYNTSSLVVSQTQDAHAELAHLLAGLRKTRAPLAQLQAAAPAADGGNVAREDEFTTRTFTLLPPNNPADMANALRTLDAESWTEPGVELRTSNQQLIVRQRRAVQGKVANYLISSNALAAPPGRGGNHRGGGMGGGMGGTGGGMGGGMF